MPRFASSSSLSFAAVCVLLSACAGDLENPERFDAVLKRFDGGTGHPGLLRDAGSGSGARDAGSSGDAPPACVTQLFNKTCGAVGCHEKGNMTLDLVSAGVTERLVDQKSESTMCEGKTYIDSSGGESLLFEKLGQSPPCGARMPLVGTLTAQQKTCLTDWISSLGGAIQ